MVKGATIHIPQIRSKLSLLQASTHANAYRHFSSKGPAAVWCRVCQCQLTFSKRFLPLNLERHNRTRKHRDYVWKRRVWTELRLTRRDVTSLSGRVACGACRASTAGDRRSTTESRRMDDTTNTSSHPQQSQESTIGGRRPTTSGTSSAIMTRAACKAEATAIFGVTDHGSAGETNAAAAVGSLNRQQEGRT